MSFSVRVVPLILLALLSVAIPLRAQSPPKLTTKVPQGSVSGRITIKDKPAPGVVVGLRKIMTGSNPEMFVKTTTDHDGVYRITNVAPGTYEVVPSAAAFVIGDSNPNRVKNVIVGEDENVADINFTLVRGGVITGKIVDADGRAMIQEPVYLYRLEATAQQPQRPMVFVKSMQTDDRGVYRFFGLTAGRYKVAAGRPEETHSGYQPSRTVYKQVFHPDVAELDKANIIEIREGSEANDVDVKLGRPLQTFRASGRIVGEDGQPVPHVQFGLQRTVAQRVEMVRASALTNNQGNFTIEGLTPGKYGVFLHPDPARMQRAETTTFDVIDGDVTGITVRLKKGSTVSGVIVFEHEDKKAWARLLQLRLHGYPSSPSGHMEFGQTGASANIAPDGSFQLTGLSPGSLNIWFTEAAGGKPPQGFLISRVEHNGVAVPYGLEIKDGDNLTGVRVFVSYGTGTVRGVVTYDASLLPEGGRMSAGLVKPGPSSNSVANTFVDARGHFLMEGVPAGVYEISVRLFVPGSRLPQPTTKQLVTVQDGVVSEVSLTLNPAPPQKP